LFLQQFFWGPLEQNPTKIWVASPPLDMVSTFLNGRSMFVEGRSERPRYLYSDLCSSRTANFIFPNVCPRGSVLVTGIRLWSGVPLPIY
jgi:hypothetical protein